MQFDVACSVDIEGAGGPPPEGEARWDYLTIRAINGTGVAIEVHPAQQRGEVDRMIRKKTWAMGFLKTHAAFIEVELPWLWVLPRGSSFGLPRTGIQARRLAQHNISLPKRVAQ